MKIPMLDLGAQHVALRDRIDAGLASVFETGQFVLGPNVAAFEREAAAYLGVEHAVACASGTDALHLALRALGLGPGDEVITTAFTFAATAEAIRYVGARPRFVDIDAQTFNIDPEQVAAAIGPATRAILPVHVFGQSVDMEPLQVLAARHGLYLVEDCAQSFGATRDGRCTGGLGDAGCFSFFPSKNLGACGDGGMVTTNSRALASAVLELRNHGGQAPHRHRVIGYNSRLDEIQAVILRIKLERIETFNEARRCVAQQYSERLAELRDIVTPNQAATNKHVYNLYTLLLPQPDVVAGALADRGIASGAYYRCPLHRQPAFAADAPGLSLPVTEAVAERCLSLPLYPELTELQIDYIVDALRSALVKRRYSIQKCGPSVSSDVSGRSA